jgi:hypothetical protein
MSEKGAGDEGDNAATEEDILLRITTLMDMEMKE